jgi:hypothetical protein
MPLIAGAGLLGNVLASSSFAPIGIIVATMIGLLSPIVGLIRVRNQPSGGLFAGLGSGLAGIVLLTAVWTGAPVLPMAVRLATFVPAVLLLAQPRGAVRQPVSPESNTGIRQPGTLPRVAAYVVVYLAVSGIPLTVGFSTLSSLYGAWQTWGGFVLVLVMVLALSLWLATIVLAGRESPSVERDGWRWAVPLLIPVAGLMQLPTGVTTTSLAAWIAIISAAVAGLILGRFLPSLESLGGLLRESIAPPASAARIGSVWQRFHGLTTSAVADALDILQGDFGLLWLLGLILLLLWLA